MLKYAEKWKNQRAIFIFLYCRIFIIHLIWKESFDQTRGLKNYSNSSKCVAKDNKPYGMRKIGHSSRNSNIIIAVRRQDPQKVISEKTWNLMQTKKPTTFCLYVCWTKCFLVLANEKVNVNIATKLGFKLKHGYEMLCIWWYRTIHVLL